MFCERCKIDFQPNEKTLWCKVWECPNTTQRQPTQEQIAQYRIDVPGKRRWREDETAE